jgi:hypothetical protein
VIFLYCFPSFLRVASLLVAERIQKFNISNMVPVLSLPRDSIRVSQLGETIPHINTLRVNGVYRSVRKNDVTTLMNQEAVASKLWLDCMNALDRTFIKIRLIYPSGDVLKQAIQIVETVSKFDDKVLPEQPEVAVVPRGSVRVTGRIRKLYFS